MQKTRKLTIFDRHVQQKPPGHQRAAFFVDPPPVAKSPGAAFPTDLVLGPPMGGSITTLPIAVVRDPPTERLLLRKAEPPKVSQSDLPPTEITETEDTPRVAKRTRKPAPKAKASKPGKKAAKPTKRVAAKKAAAKTGRKTVVRKRKTTKTVAKPVVRNAPKAKTPKIKAANDAGMPLFDTAIPPVSAPMATKVREEVALMKDTAPALPPTMPLPRAAAVTAWRKSGPIDVLAFWLRRSARSILALFKVKAKYGKNVKPKAPPPPTLTNSELEGLRAENALLRQRIEQLLDSRMEKIREG